MAYLQTTAASVDDILNSIATFAAALGWTVERNDTYTSSGNSRRILSLSRAGYDYAHFASELSAVATPKTRIYTMRSQGVNVALDLLSQPNKSTQAESNFLSAGAYSSLYLFGESGSNPYIHVVLEHQSGRYRHFSIGELIKKGTWTGGSYCQGTWWEVTFTANSPVQTQHSKPFSEFTYNTNIGAIRCDEADSTANALAGVSNDYALSSIQYTRRVVTGFMCGQNQTLAYVDCAMGLLTASFNYFNQRTVLARIAHFVTCASNFYRYLGEPPAIRAINMYAFAATEELTIGSDTWKVFPVVRKGTSAVSTEEYSGNYGLAYKKVS